MYTLTSEQERRDARYDPYRRNELPLLKCIRYDTFSEKSQDMVKRIINEVATWNVDEEYLAAWKKKKEDDDRWW